MSAFGSNEHLTLMAGLFALGLVYWAARSTYRWWHTRPLSHWKIQRLRADANAYITSTAEQPAPGTPSPGAGPEPLSAARAVLPPPAQPRSGQGQTPVDVARTPDTTTSTGLNPRDGVREVPVETAAAGFPEHAAAPRSAA